MDNRKSDRLTLGLPVFYKLAAEADWTGPLIVDDMGGGGMRFRTPQAIPRPSELYIKIELPDKGRPILLKGHVTWTRTSPLPHTHLVGVKFGKMPHKDRQRFLAFMCENILVHNLTEDGKLAAK